MLIGSFEPCGDDITRGVVNWIHLEDAGILPVFLAEDTPRRGGVPVRERERERETACGRDRVKEDHISLSKVPLSKKTQSRGVNESSPGWRTRS